MANEAAKKMREELESATDEAVIACGGNARAAVRTLLVLLDSTEAEIRALKAEVARIETTVSGGYIRKNLRSRSGR